MSTDFLMMALTMSLFDDNKDEVPMKKPQTSTHFIFNTSFPKQSPILIIIVYL